MTLPSMKYEDGIGKSVQSQFGGYNHTRSAADGELWDMGNLGSDEYPLLSPRARRYHADALAKPNGIYGHDELALVDGTQFSYGGVVKGTVTDSEKTIIALGSYLLIFPDKAFYNITTDTFGQMEAGYSSGAGEISFHDGSLYEEMASANCITTSGEAFPFRIGDAVTITGCTTQSSNNKTPVIREISEDGKTLRFYENIFTIESGVYAEATLELEHDASAAAEFYAGSSYSFDPSGSFSVDQSTKIALSSAGAQAASGKYYIEKAEESSSKTGRVMYKIISAQYLDERLKMSVQVYYAAETYSEPGAVTLKRQVPDMDYLCVNENRLWGCKGKTIFASKLGDPFNFYVFDGLPTDSWSVDDLSEGDFTGCATYLGFPIFFKERSIAKVYGTHPSNFQLMGSASLGVKQGSGKSLAVAGEILFYHGRTGIVAYQGGIPEVISANFGEAAFSQARAGSDGRKYYISMQDEQGSWQLFVFDTRNNLWMREDDTEAVGFACMDKLYCLNRQGELWTHVATGQAEDEFAWWAETADYYFNTLNRKGVNKYHLRLELAEGAEATLYAQFDGNGYWQQVARMSTPAKRTYYLPLIPRRGDHFRLRLEGRGQAWLYGLGIEHYTGSELG